VHYSASTIKLKRLVGEISNNQNAKQLISHSQSPRAMERVIFCQIEASEGKTFYSTKKKNNLPKHTYNTNNWGGGEVVGEQCAKKFLFESPGLVDFGIGLVIFVLNLPDAQVFVFWKFKLQKDCNQS